MKEGVDARTIRPFLFLLVPWRLGGDFYLFKWVCAPIHAKEKP
jgi:hypothetical protein